MRVKRHVLVCWLILCMLKSLRFSVLQRAFGFLMGDNFSFCRRSFCGQLSTKNLRLHLPCSSSCFPCDQLHYRSCCWDNLDLTSNDHNIMWACIFCLEWLKIFFCTGVVSWPSCDYFIGKIQTEGMRHAYPLLWELQHEKKTVFLIFDVYLLIHFYVLVKVWSIYLNFTLPLSNRVVPILALYWAVILILFYALDMWSAMKPQPMAWLVCLLCRTCTTHCCLFCCNLPTWVKPRETLAFRKRLVLTETPELISRNNQWVSVTSRISHCIFAFASFGNEE